MERAGVQCAIPFQGEKAFRWPKNDPDCRAEMEALLSRSLGVSSLSGHVEVMALAAALNPLNCLVSEMRPLGLLAEDADSSNGALIQLLFGVSYLPR